MPFLTLPNSRIDFILFTNFKLFVVTIPPSPVVITFVEKKLNPAAVPNVPAFFLFNDDP